jgi:adenylylsulfate kinase-like enzyme
VQYVIRPHLDYRGYAAEIASGWVAQGDEVMVLPSRRRTRVTSIDTFEGPIERASAPMSVTLTLADNVDVSRGDMLVHPDNVPHVEQRFEAMLVWMNEKELDLEASYFIKHTTVLVRAEFERVLSRTNLETLDEDPASSLSLNDIGRVVVRSRRPLYFDAYSDNHRTGAFIVVDALSNATVAAGMISGPAGGGGEPSIDTSARSRIDPRERQSALGQRGAVILLTGLPGAGKTDLAYATERVLHARGRFSLVVDPGDAVSAKNAALARHPAEVPASALELCERGAEVGWITLLAFAAPDAEARARVRERSGRARYLEVHVVRAGAEGSSELRYEPPATPDVQVNLAEEGIERAAQRLVELLEAYDVFPTP